MNILRMFKYWTIQSPNKCKVFDNNQHSFLINNNNKKVSTTKEQDVYLKTLQVPSYVKTEWFPSEMGKQVKAACSHCIHSASRTACGQGDTARRWNKRTWIGKEEAMVLATNHTVIHVDDLWNLKCGAEPICGFSKFSESSQYTKSIVFLLRDVYYPTWLFITKLKFLKQHWVKKIK